MKKISKLLYIYPALSVQSVNEATDVNIPKMQFSNERFKRKPKKQEKIKFNN